MNSTLHLIHRRHIPLLHKTVLICYEGCRLVGVTMSAYKHLRLHVCDICFCLDEKAFKAKMKFNILESVMCLYFLCQVASGGSSSSSSSSNGNSGKGPRQKIQELNDRLDKVEGKLAKICDMLAEFTGC